MSSKPELLFAGATYPGDAEGISKGFEFDSERTDEFDEVAFPPPPDAPPPTGIPNCDLCDYVVDVDNIVLRKLGLEDLHVLFGPYTQIYLRNTFILHRWVTDGILTGGRRKGANLCSTLNFGVCGGYHILLQNATAAVAASVKSGMLSGLTCPHNSHGNFKANDRADLLVAKNCNITADIFSKIAHQVRVPPVTIASFVTKMPLNWNTAGRCTSGTVDFGFELPTSGIP